MKITLIEAYLISNKRNATLSHSPSMAIAYLASYLSDKGIQVKVIDAIGEGINNIPNTDTWKLLSTRYSAWKEKHCPLITVKSD